MKYGSPEQRLAIAKELEGRYVELAKAKYGKFLVGKILEYGYVCILRGRLICRNAEVRELVVKEFLGNDIYRDIGTPAQKLEMLQELYGPEFRLFKVRKIWNRVNGRPRKACL
jgi:pumilio family protein 6